MRTFDTNADRATAGQMGLEAYAKSVNMADEEPHEMNLTDLLADLMHFCDREQIDFHSCVARAHDHYREEVREEMEG